jgi:hypothetical protein
MGVMKKICMYFGRKLETTNGTVKKAIKENRVMEETVKVWEDRPKIRVK